MTLLSTNLKRLRSTAGLSILQVATAISVNPKTYAAWETRNIEPPLNKLIEVARFYNVTVDDLITGEVELESLLLASLVKVAPDNVQKAIYNLLNLEV
jgi:transcriptional regulator with XRE-family HTH domain